MVWYHTDGGGTGDFKPVAPRDGGWRIKERRTPRRNPGFKPVSKNCLRAGSAKVDVAGIGDSPNGKDWMECEQQLPSIGGAADLMELKRLEIILPRVQ